MKNFKVVVLGLDRAGKTVLINYLISKKPDETFRPTLSFAIKKFPLPDRVIIFWDAPGQVNLRSSWMKSIKNADCLMYLVDTSNIDRLEESIKEFQRVTRQIINFHIPLIFCYHKIDLPSAKANLERIKTEFDVDGKYKEKVFQVETSIQEAASIAALEKILKTFDQ